jgi:hypothetical protein
VVLVRKANAAVRRPRRNRRPIQSRAGNAFVAFPAFSLALRGFQLAANRIRSFTSPGHEPVLGKPDNPHPGPTHEPLSQVIGNQRNDPKGFRGTIRGNLLARSLPEMKVTGRLLHHPVTSDSLVSGLRTQPTGIKAGAGPAPLAAGVLQFWLPDATPQSVPPRRIRTFAGREIAGAVRGLRPAESHRPVCSRSL